MTVNLPHPENNQEFLKIAFELFNIFIIKPATSKL